MATPRKKAAATEEPEEDPVEEEPEDEGAIEEGETEFQRERDAAEADKAASLEPPRAPEDQEAVTGAKRKVIGLTNRNGVELSNGQIVTVRLGQETLLEPEVAEEMVTGGLVAYL